MTDEKPTIPESIFVHVMNLVKVDAARSIIFKLQPSDILKQEDKENLVLILNTMWKEHDDEFNVLAKEYDEPENLHVNEPPPPTEEKDEEGDVQKENSHQ